MFDDLLDNPLLLAVGAGVLALLGGFGVYRHRLRKKSAQVDSSFLESRLQPDSFFGASGGQRIDTNDGAATGSSMVYSPSQLDAAGDVDPVAEADVYLAYGRDLQAEEILKEALRSTPNRVAIHSKLLEIYSKRRDTKGFEVMAAEAFTLTQGVGPEWEHIAELGKELDPANPLFQPGGHPSTPVTPTAAKGQDPSLFAPSTIAQPNGFNQPTEAMPVRPELGTSATPVDLDFDLDFSLPEPATANSAMTATAPMQAVASAPDHGLDMDLDGLPSLDHPQPHGLNVPDLALSQHDRNVPAAAVPAPPAAPQSNSGMIEFDLGSLSLDLDSLSPQSTSGQGAGVPGEDPAATKLALAQEFHAIGDTDGARALVEEVLAEATGSLKAQAKRLLAELT